MSLSTIIFRNSDPEILNRYYHVLTAVRGPDLTDVSTMKYVFTGRIRYWLFGDKSSVGIIRKEKLTVEDIENLCYDVTIIADDRSSRVAIYHYLNHVYGSLQVLASYFLFGEEKSEALTLRDLAEDVISMIQNYDPRNFFIDAEANRIIEKYPDLVK